MTAKEYLSQIHYLNLKINYLKKQIEDYQVQMRRISSADFDSIRIDKSPSLEAPFIKPMEKLSEAEDKLKVELINLKNLKNEIIKTINKVEDEEYRILLKYRYIHHCSFREIAIKMYVSETSIRRRHNEALSMIILTKPL
ncbi:MAG: DUF1492 domain-containing protein [Candidatus Izemoplasmatales bacterium]|nr:DUF1492 domain-containing protein [Candidatus Izemoplasmatales bacterium]